MENVFKAKRFPNLSPGSPVDIETGEGAVGKDLMYEGIMTSRIQAVSWKAFCWVGKDLMYEGIMTLVSKSGVLVPTFVGKDLMYEGIMTYLSSTSYANCIIVGKDLMYEGIMTLVSTRAPAQ